MKKTLILFSVLAAALVLSGCSLSSAVPVKNTMADATFIKSADGAVSWEPKMKIDDKKTIAGIDVLSMAIKPNDPNVIYIGTVANGLFSTKDAGETWTQVPFANKAYGLVFDFANPEIIYGSGLLDNRGKIYKREAEGQEWKEVYTEPSTGTIISSLVIDRTNSQILYAGTNEGVIIKTTDGGRTWVNLEKAEGPVTSIAFDAANSAHIFFGVFQKGIIETKDGGKTMENITRKIDPISGYIGLDAVVADPNAAGIVYIGTDKGIIKSSADGKWSELNIIESSKAFPIRSIAINPQNSKEMIYSSAKAIYKSTDAGVTWATFQLDSAKEIGVLKYDPLDPMKVYAGLRKF